MTAVRTNVIAIVVVLSLAGGFLLAALVPGRKTLTARHQRIDAVVSQVKTDAQSLSDMGALFAEIQELEQDNERYRARVPEERRFGEFLNQLSECLKTAGIADFEVQPRPARELTEASLPEELRKAKGMTVLSVAISFTSRFENVFNFMNALESFPRLSHVESMTITNQEDEVGRVTVEMVLQTYYRPEAAQAETAGRS